jgi:hypothetical protein
LSQFFRYSVLVKFEDFNIDFLDDVFNKRAAEAVIVIIPKDASKISEKLIAQWK